MATVCLDSQYVPYTDYLEKGKTDTERKRIQQRNNFISIEHKMDASEIFILRSWRDISPILIAKVLRNFHQISIWLEQCYHKLL